jgi:hypothetical protein
MLTGLLRLQRHSTNVIMYLFCKWKHKLCLDFPPAAKAILYDKNERPKLFAYFVQGGSGQVLDNAHGNVYFGLQMVLHVQCIC